MELTKEMAAAVAALIEMYPVDFSEMVEWQKTCKARENVPFWNWGHVSYRREAAEQVEELLKELNKAK